QLVLRGFRALEVHPRAATHASVGDRAWRARSARPGRLLCAAAGLDGAEERCQLGDGATTGRRTRLVVPARAAVRAARVAAGAGRAADAFAPGHRRGNPRGRGRVGRRGGRDPRSAPAPGARARSARPGGPPVLLVRGPGMTEPLAR